MNLQSIVTKLSEIHSDQPIDLDVDVVYDEVLERADELEITRHPLGFIQVDFAPIVSLPAGKRARLHVWDNNDGSRDDLGDLHTHVWSLTSWVMRGRLDDQTFDPVANDDGELFGSRVKESDIYEFPRVGRYDLIPLQRRAPRTGDVYTIPAGLVHESHVLDVPTSTLLLSTDNAQMVGEGPLVLTKRPQGAKGTTRRPRLSREELHRAISKLRQPVA
jgi:hypothetical protein